MSRGERAFRVAMALLLTAATVAGAQTYGQWQWSTEVGVRQRRSETFAESRGTALFDERQLAVSLGIQGYILHPMVGSFRVDVDGLFSQYEGTRAVDQDRLGVRSNLRLFPRGRYPARLFFNHSLYGYADVDAPARPALLRGAPDTTTHWGAETRLRRGKLKGMFLGFDQFVVRFLEPELSDQVVGRQFADWSRSGERVKHAYRLERQSRRYDNLGFATDDLTATISENGEVLGGWLWSLSGVGITRDLELAGQPRQSFDSLFVRNRMTKSSSGKRELRLDYTGALRRSSNADTAVEQTLSARYSWNPWDGLQVAPVVSYSHQDGRGRTVRAPQAGVSLVWSRSLEESQLFLTGQVLAGRLSGDQPDGEIDQRLVTYSLGGGFSFGTEATLRSQLEATYTINDLRAEEFTADLPDLGTSLVGGGSEDRFGLRLTLRRRWGRFLGSVQSELTERRRGMDFGIGEFTLESVMHRLNLDGRRFSLGVHVGTTDLERLAPERLEFQTWVLRLHPLPRLSVGAFYRTDVRMLELSPEIDSERLTVDVSWSVGAYRIQGQWSESTEHRTVGGERILRDFNWSLSRRFGGWLPWISGPQRRGVIR